MLLRRSEQYFSLRFFRFLYQTATGFHASFLIYRPADVSSCFGPQMRCSQSKIENEEAIARCKDRKIHMKDALAARNAFASAHSAYVMFLKNTGAFLSDYAHGEVQNPQLLNGTAQSNSKINYVAASYEPLVPPLPPPFSNFPSPLHRAVSMPEMNILKSDLKPVGPIIEEENENES